MGQQDDVTASQLAGPGGDLLEYRHHGPGRGQEGAGEGDGVAFFPAGLRRPRIERIGLAPSRGEVAELMGTGLRSAILWVRGVQQDTSARSLIEGIEARDLRRQSTDEHPCAELQLQYRHDVVYGCHPDPEPLAQLGGVLLGLDRDIAWQQRPLGRIVAGPPHPQKVLQFQFGLHEGGEQGDGCLDVRVGLARPSEPWLQIDLHRFAPQQAVDRHPVEGRELLQFVEPRLALALLDGDHGCARNLQRLCGRRLGHLRRFARDPEAVADLGRGQFFTHGLALARRDTKESQPKALRNPRHSAACRPNISRNCCSTAAGSPSRASAVSRAARRRERACRGDSARSAKWSMCKTPATA